MRRTTIAAAAAAAVIAGGAVAVPAMASGSDPAPSREPRRPRRVTGLTDAQQQELDELPGRAPQGRAGAGHPARRAGRRSPTPTRPWSPS